MGITGRTEVFIGTLRIAVGPVVEVAGHKVVFDANFYDDPSGGYPIASILTSECICNLTDMATKRIQIWNDDVVPEGVAPGDGGGAGGGGGTGDGTGGARQRPWPGGQWWPGGRRLADRPCGGGPAAGAGGPAGGIGSPAPAASKACSTAKASAPQGRPRTVKTAKKLAATRAKQAKSAPAAKRTAARKKAKQAQTALKQAQKTQTTARRNQAALLFLPAVQPVPRRAVRPASLFPGARPLAGRDAGLVPLGGAALRQGSAELPVALRGADSGGDGQHLGGPLRLPGRSAVAGLLRADQATGPGRPGSSPPS